MIGLGPQSFHYDLSKSYVNSYQLFRYFIAFDDLHNFWLPKETYKKIFNPSYLSFRLSTEIPDANNIYLEKISNLMSLENKINTFELANHWNRAYPETCKENTKILDDYLTLCENHNVQPIIFLLPFSYGAMKYLNKKIVDELRYIVSEAQKKYPNSLFLDGWKLNIFDDEDFYESTHLNIQGAAKFSVILNSFIEHFDENY